MRKKSVSYSSPDSGGWLNMCDQLFLAQFRGRPCEICGAHGGWDGKKMRSCGHHIIFKGVCRKHRYEKKNIIVLCPSHHSHYNKELSPHSITSTDAQGTFKEWVRENKPEQYKWWQDHKKDDKEPFDKSWCYREKYEELGGEIASKSGLLKDMRPVNHATKVRDLEMRNRACELCGKAVEHAGESKLCSYCYL